ncbi:Glutamyl-tRNA synthetase (EC [Olavius sp. associated proteobacterium Delta 1]|nr:Glutamyl-tRNA synthetase (EC [Olavius sp. associated proteobacterium Delta 1]
MEKIITRFPPSPTGYLHVGGARTAIFNWLYARHMNGKFVLRIEDTDIQRSTQASVDAIFEALQWLGIDWDEGPYFQTQRFEIYREYIQKLVDSGHAYYCTCSPEQIDAMRQAAMASGDKPRYDGTCREMGRIKTTQAVVRFKAPLSGTTVVEDVIKGNIVFKNDELDDFVICRSDGTPTYNFVVVVDDITMNINTIIRGDDHVMNTPKQILLYRALGSPLPTFGHVPMVLGNDRARLSKRHGAMSVTAYRDMGYLPDALLNYLVRLGWSHGDQEFFTREELINAFDIEHIGRSAGIFDIEKLQAINADHIQASAASDLVDPLWPFLKDRGIEIEDGDYTTNVIQTLQPRSKTLTDMADAAMFYYLEDIIFEEKAARKFLKAAALEPLRLLVDKLESSTDYSEKNLEGVFKAVMDETGLKLGKIAQPVRVALTGKTASPGIFEIITILGPERVIPRLGKAIQFIEANLDKSSG